MDRKMIIFFDFANLNYGGGCEKNFMKLGDWLSKRGYEIKFITASKKLNDILSSILKTDKYTKNISDKDLYKKFKVKDYQTFDLKDLLLSTKNRDNIINLLKKADVIMSKNEFLEITILKFFFNVEAEKIVFGIHTPIFYTVAKDFKSKLHNVIYNSPFYFKSLGNSRARFLTLNESQKDIIKKKVRLDKIVVIPNSIDTKKFRKKKFKKRANFSIYYMGRMIEAKGLDILSESVKKLSSNNEFKNMQFYFVGTGEQEFYLKNLAEKFDNCHFLGFKTDVLKYYHSADITLVPSRWEGFPYAVLESQSTGTPVVTTDIPGCRDIIIDKKTGWICNPQDIDDLTDKIMSAYNLWKSDFKRFKKIGIDARKNVIKNYAEDKINKKIEEFIFKK